MTCPFSGDGQRLLSQSLGKLPKGSTCQDWKKAPARSSYWRDETDEVTRCAKWATGGEGKSDRDRSAPPSKDGGPDGWPEGRNGWEQFEPDSRYLVVAYSGENHNLTVEEISSGKYHTVAQISGSLAGTDLKTGDKETTVELLTDFMAEFDGDESHAPASIKRWADGWEPSGDSSEGGDSGSVYDEYRDIKIMRGTVLEEFDALLSMGVIRDLRDAFETCRSLSGATFKQVRENSDIGSGGMKQLFGTTSADSDMTVAHAQQKRNLGPFGKDVEPKDAPDRVNGWELEREEKDKIDYTAEWYDGLPTGKLDIEPHEVDEAMVTVTHTGSSKFPKRWTTSINVWSEDDKNVYNTDLEHSMGDNNVENRNSALQDAIGWINGHPAEEQPEPEPEDGEEEEDQETDISQFPDIDVRGDNGRLREVTEPWYRFGGTKMGDGNMFMTVDSEGAIDFLGTDGDNVVMYETSLLLGSVEKASVHREGQTVAVDGDGLSNAVNDVNMTEDFRLYTDGRTLVYEGGGRTSEFELSRNLTGEPSLPDVDIGATVNDVDLNRFTNRLKGISKIAQEAVALVLKPEEAYMVTENSAGERARAEITDDSGDITFHEHQDRYAALYGYDYLNDVRKSPYAPKSTNLRIGMFHLEGEAHEEGRYTSAPLTVEYEQRGGFVKYVIAPRVPTDDNGAAEWDLSAPPCPVHSVSDGLELAEPLETGEKVPDIGGMDLHNGDSVIWTFPKADGCRCGSQALQYEQLASELDVPVYGIAAVPPEDLQEMADRFDLEAITLISDPEGELASQFGVEFNDEDRLERTTMFVRDGRVNDVSDGVSPPELSQPDSGGCPIKSVSDPVMLAQKNESKLYESINHPSVYVITGSRGAGKSALAHQLGEKLREKEDVIPVTIGTPQHVRDEYPNYWVHVDEMKEAPSDSIVVVDEAYMKFNAREAMKGENKLMGAYVNTSRHCNRTIVFVSQNSGHLDKMAVSEADGILIKEPGTFHMEFERKQLRDITERAKSSYEQLPNRHDRREYVYAVNDNFEGLVENAKPDWYGDNVSKAYGAACGAADDAEAEADD